MHSRHIKFSPLNAHRSVPTGGGCGGLCLALGLHPPGAGSWWSLRCCCCRRSSCLAAADAKFVQLAQLHLPLDGRPPGAEHHAIVCLPAAVLGRRGHGDGQLDDVPAQQSTDQHHHHQVHHQSEPGRRFWGHAKRQRSQQLEFQQQSECEQLSFP